MRARHPLPRIWLMTDERLGDGLLQAVKRLPRGSGIVFRHYSMEPSERRRLFRQVRAVARAKRHMLLLAGHPARAAAWGADGSHGLFRGKVSAPHLTRSVAVHNFKELKAAEQCGADLIFVSPVFPTRSHPGARTLGVAGYGLLARAARMPVIALGGMSAAALRRLRSLEPYGWAGIDAFA